MTTAENLLQLKQDFDDVYAKAYEKGKSEGGSGFPTDFEWAKQTEVATIRDLNWGTETLTINFPKVTSHTFGLNVINETVKHLIINYGTPLTTLNRGFYWGTEAGVLEHLTLSGDLSQVTSYRQMFSTNPKLKILDGSPLDFSSSTNNSSVFGTSAYLEYVRFVRKSIKISADFSGCRNLNGDSIQSMVDGLADCTSGKTQTLTLRTEVVTNLTETQWAQIYAKNWQVM